MRLASAPLDEVSHTAARGPVRAVEYSRAPIEPRQLVAWVHDGDDYEVVVAWVRLVDRA